MKRQNAQAENFRVTAKTALLRKKMTIAKLAHRLGNPRQTVSGAINSKRFPRVRARVAKVLGIAL